MLNDLRTRLTGLLRDSRKRSCIIIAMAAMAVLLILCSDISCAERNDSPAGSDSSDDYAAVLEQKLVDIISSVDGAGETRVLVTLQSGKEYIYASEDSTSTDSSASVDSSGRQSSDERQDRQSTHIIIDTDQGEQALIRTELMPAINGVVVVCQGADDPLVAERIMAVVTTALGISSKRVCITQLSQ